MHCYKREMHCGSKVVGPKTKQGSNPDLPIEIHFSYRGLLLVSSDIEIRQLGTSFGLKKLNKI